MLLAGEGDFGVCLSDNPAEGKTYNHCDASIRKDALV